MGYPPPPAVRHVATGPRRSDIARHMRVQAQMAEQVHPALGTPRHLRDAAESLSRGNTEGAKRHLRAAMNLYQPLSLVRHGILDDEGHTAGRQHLAAIHALHLQVQDVEDTEQGNQQRLALHHDAVRQRAALPRGGPSFQQGQTGVPGPAERGSTAMNAPARTSAGPSDGAAAGPKAPAPPGSKQFSSYDLSAQTGALAVTPRPYGKPGGPGLYGVKGLKHSDYLENIVHALMTKRGFDKGKATAIARGAIRKWMRGGGKVHPEVRAAAAGAEAEELRAQARAKAGR